MPQRSNGFLTNHHILANWNVSCTGSNRVLSLQCVFQDNRSRIHRKSGSLHGWHEHNCALCHPEVVLCSWRDIRINKKTNFCAPRLIDISYCWACSFNPAVWENPIHQSSHLPHLQPPAVWWARCLYIIARICQPLPLLRRCRTAVCAAGLHSPEPGSLVQCWWKGSAGKQWDGHVQITDKE